ncbi:MAG: sigma-54 dependent transcriptional regulator [Candidatus Neomarinimicrobiota bacterium]
MKILVVDDERAQREALAGFLRTLNYETHTADSAQTALAFLHRNPVDVVLSDFKMPYLTGNDLLKEIRARYPGTVVFIMTAYGTVEAAVEAMKAGAWDFVAKPVDLDQLERQLTEVRNYQDQSVRAAKTDSVESSLIARDPVMLELLVKARKVAASEATVLLTGETGTGKEELARYIHAHSRRRKKNLHAVNCAALPANLIESELFGHKKGAFTGAVADRKGHFEIADGSTLLLDEIGDLPREMQVKLLRFLQNGEFQPVGSDELRRADVRIIAATNVDLQLAVEQGDFREDLYYRLDVIRFQIPPLRERPADVALLTDVFLAEFSEKHGRKNVALDETARQALLSYTFPGNVRELRNIIERALVLAADKIAADDLELRSLPARSDGSSGLSGTVQALERDLIVKTLAETRGNQSECARRLNISERVLRYKLQKYNLR